MAQPTIQEAFDLALRQHQAGQLQAVENLCRQILAQEPAHHDAMQLLGVVAYQVGRNDVAAELIRKAIALHPNWPEANVNLGNVLLGLKQIDEAIAAYRQAIALRPGYADAYGNLGAALRDNGKLAEAIEAYQTAIRNRPGFPEAHNNLGTALKENGQLDEGIDSYRRAIALRPGFPEAHVNLGDALKQRGRHEEAIAAYRQAIALRPGYADAYNNLGVALRENGRLDEAIEAYRKAIALKPDKAESFGNLGNALQARGQFDEAREAHLRAGHLNVSRNRSQPVAGTSDEETRRLDQAVSACRQDILAAPDKAELHRALGVLLSRQGNFDGAIAAFRRALELEPKSAETYYNLASALGHQGSVDDTIAAYQQAVVFDSKFARAWVNMGVVLLNAGRLDEALAAFRQAVELEPTDSKAHTNLVFILNYHPDYDAQAIAEEQRRWNVRHARPVAGCIRPHTNDRDPGRRLRIGYVSPDFCHHVVGKNILPLFRRHDHWQFEIFAYSQLANPDPMTAQFQQCADGWRDTVGLSDEQVAEQIREDRIDILVDLALHTAGYRGNRLLVFARKPAPVQVTFAGYPGSTGLTAIDYRLTDPYLDPVGMDESIYSERTVRLPNSFWCYDPLDQAEKFPLTHLPALQNGFITFGSLNNFCKINEQVLALWARVLRQVSNSRLLLLAPDGCIRERTMEFLACEGIDPSRVELVGHGSRRKYLESYHRIDIGLDSFPYNGHTTSLDSFWMGVPVVTLVGKTVVARAGLCQLSNLGLSELAGFDCEQFVKIAVELAGDIPRLQQLRSTLRERMEQSPLMDAAGFTHGIEAAYRRLWHDYCAR